MEAGEASMLAARLETTREEANQAALIDAGAIR
jgi:hypothetical protein